MRLPGYGERMARRRHYRQWGSKRRRAVRGYTLRNRRGKVLYVGTTNNPRRRSVEHKKSGKRGRMKVETVGMPRGLARRWEAGRLARHRRQNKGRNPRYNKTRSGS